MKNYPGLHGKIIFDGKSSYFIDLLILLAFADIHYASSLAMDSLLSMERTNDLDVNDEETAGGGSAVLSPFAGKAFLFLG